MIGGQEGLPGVVDGDEVGMGTSSQKVEVQMHL
jgi:hypothetical protein